MKMLIGGLITGLLLTATVAQAHPWGDEGARDYRYMQERNWQERHWEHERREHERAEHWYRDRYNYYPAPAQSYYYDYSYAPRAAVSGPGFYFSWTD